MRSSRWRWHLDEVFVKIDGEMHYLWRAVDHEGEVLESFVTKTRDTKIALKLMKKTLKRHGQPEVFVGDCVRAERAGQADAEGWQVAGVERCKFDWAALSSYGCCKMKIR